MSGNRDRAGGEGSEQRTKKVLEVALLVPALGPSPARSPWAVAAASFVSTLDLFSRAVIKTRSHRFAPTMNLY